MDEVTRESSDTGTDQEKELWRDIRKRSTGADEAKEKENGKEEQEELAACLEAGQTVALGTKVRIISVTTPLNPLVQ